MRALAEIQTVNEQANGAGVWETHPGTDASSPAVKKLNEQASDAIAEYTKKNNLLSDFMLKGF